MCIGFSRLIRESVIWEQSSFFFSSSSFLVSPAPSFNTFLYMCVCVCVCVCTLSHVQLLAAPQTVACQAPLSINFPGKNPGVGCHFLLQGIFLTQSLNLYLLCFLHWQADFFPLCHLESLHSCIFNSNSLSTSCKSLY